MKKYLLFILLIPFILLGCQNSTGNSATGEEAESAETINIKLAHGGDPGHPWDDASKQFAEQVEEESDGQIVVQTYTAGQMGNDQELLESTASGSLEMSVVASMAMSGFEPSLQIFDLPYLFPNVETAYDVLDGEIGEEVASVLIDKGVRSLEYWENGYRNISNSKHPIESVEDLKGLKIRVPQTPALISWLEKVGAIPTQISYTELYTALQQGAVDGQDNGIFLTHSAKYYETQDYYSLTEHIYSPALLLINEEFFQSLSEEHQEIITTAAAEARDYQRQLDAERESELLEQMEEEGLEVKELPAEEIEKFKDSAQSVYEELEEEINDELLQKILDETE